MPVLLQIYFYLFSEFWIFLGKKLMLDYVINTKVKFCLQNFSQKFIFERKNKFATKKGIKNFLPQICVFAYQKMHTLQFLHTKTI